MRPLRLTDASCGNIAAAPTTSQLMRPLPLRIHPPTPTLAQSVSGRPRTRGRWHRLRPGHADIFPPVWLNRRPSYYPPFRNTRQRIPRRPAYIAGRRRASTGAIRRAPIHSFARLGRYPHPRYRLRIPFPRKRMQRAPTDSGDWNVSLGATLTRLL